MFIHIFIVPRFGFIKRRHHRWDLHEFAFLSNSFIQLFYCSIPSICRLKWHLDFCWVCHFKKSFFFLYFPSFISKSASNWMNTRQKSYYNIVYCTCLMLLENFNYVQDSCVRHRNYAHIIACVSEFFITDFIFHCFLFDPSFRQSYFFPRFITHWTLKTEIHLNYWEGAYSHMICSEAERIRKWRINRKQSYSKLNEESKQFNVKNMKANLRLI